MYSARHGRSARAACRLEQGVLHAERREDALWKVKAPNGLAADLLELPRPRIRKFVLLYDQREPGSKSSGRVAYSSMTRVGCGVSLHLAIRTKSSG